RMTNFPDELGQAIARAKAHAYRAGQAAAEARVKELEEVIRSIESQLRNYAQMPVADWAMPTAISGPPGWMMIRDILGSIVEYELSCLEEDDDDRTPSGPVDPDTQFLCEVYAERRRRDEERVRDMLTNLKAKPNDGGGVLQWGRT
ncbi:hypothetical protein, partial [Phenylobacterium sp.]|uniref:hypothetical protein n=2 Tax=Phenylobacterium sp. TaxID=1871053 RepID=UPI0025EE5EA4